MNLLALIPGLILGAGVALIISALIPRQPHLAATLDRLTETTIALPDAGDDSLQHRVGS